MKAMESFESSMNVEHYKAMRFRIDAEVGNDSSFLFQSHLMHS